jgi:hypothetical protein
VGLDDCFFFAGAVTIMRICRCKIVNVEFMPIDKLIRVSTYFIRVYSAVGIAATCGLDDQVKFPVGSRICSTPSRPDRFWGAPSFLSNGHGGGGGVAVSPGVKQQLSKVDPTLPTSVEIKKAWIYTSTPLLRLHGVVLN